MNLPRVTSNAASSADGIFVKYAIVKTILRRTTPTVALSIITTYVTCYRYFLNVLAVILTLIANSTANGNTMNTGCRLNGSAK